MTILGVGYDRTLSRIFSSGSRPCLDTTWPQVEHFSASKITSVNLQRTTFSLHHGKGAAERAYPSSNVWQCSISPLPNGLHIPSMDGMLDQISMTIVIIILHLHEYLGIWVSIEACSSVQCRPKQVYFRFWTGLNLNNIMWEHFLTQPNHWLWFFQEKEIINRLFFCERGNWHSKWFTDQIYFWTCVYKWMIAKT